MKIGIVGNGEDKFTAKGKEEATDIIWRILREAIDPTLVSGHSPVGGIDIWAEDIAGYGGIPKIIWAPVVHQWNPPDNNGYKWRNEMIANESDILHVIVVDVYPTDYKQKRFKYCYHCMKTDHVKSGACWTAKKTLALDKPVEWHIVSNY
jgi:hypothetical protein